jgi:RimJ/RimL family protein N-acetyltransferase
VKIKTCRFKTQRLLVKEWHSLSTDEWKQQDLKEVVMTMLAPHVTQSLPTEWRGTYSRERAQNWIENRDNEGATLLVIDKSSRIPIGLVILFEIYHKGSNDIEVRLGYLLAESAWGKGLASELIQGFVGWCRQAGITSSRRVLEKNGFVCDPLTETAEEHLFELKLRPN